MAHKWYIGCIADKPYKAFPSATEPTRSTHGHLYNAVIGPFLTKRGALWAEKYGKNNPHFRHVSDAEKIVKKWAKQGCKYPWNDRDAILT